MPHRQTLRLPSRFMSLLATFALALLLIASGCTGEIAPQTTFGMAGEDMPVVPRQQVPAETYNDAGLAMKAAERAYIAGTIKYSIELFDRVIELAPEAKPQLWQRGIALYQVGRFDEGAAQFETHATVNPFDVENSAWHLICIAASPEGDLASARKRLIPITSGRDTRVPMAEIYELYAGRGSEAAVLDAAAKDGGDWAKLYANLYIGLLREATGDIEGAKPFLREAAADSSVSFQYMGRVARIHWRRFSNEHIEKNAANKPTGEAANRTKKQKSRAAGAGRQADT